MNEDSLNINETIKVLAEKENLSMLQLCRNVNLSPQNICKKMQRNSLYFSDVEKLLEGLNFQIEIIKK